LEAVVHVAREADTTAREIIYMREEFRSRIQEKPGNSSSGLQLLDLLYEVPYLTATIATSGLSVSYPTVNNLLNSFIEYGIVQEITGRSRYRVFRFGPYIDLLQRDIGSA
jgi:Fic family protein